MDRIVKDISSFLYEDWWIWVSRRWIYSLPRNIFDIWLDHYIKTKENVLIEYDSIIYLLWRAKSTIQFWWIIEITGDDIDLFDKCINNYSYWNIYSIYNDDELVLIQKAIDIAKREYEYIETYKYKRKEAQNYIQNKKNRDRLFNMLWRKCIHCGSEERLSLDHINPVSKWGWNEDNNFQVLCVSCNSKKSNKI